MKKTLLALSVLALSMSAAAAQTTTIPASSPDRRPALPTRPMYAEGYGAKAAKTAKSPAQKADRHAAKIAKALGLTAEQEAKVETIVLARNQEMSALKAKYAAGADRKAGRADMKAVKTKYDGQLQTALGPDLYARYDKMRDEQHDRAKETNGAKMKDGKPKMKAKS